MRWAASLLSWPKTSLGTYQLQQRHAYKSKSAKLALKTPYSMSSVTVGVMSIVKPSPPPRPYHVPHHSPQANPHSLRNHSPHRTAACKGRSASGRVLFQAEEHAMERNLAYSPLISHCRRRRRGRLVLRTPRATAVELYILVNIVLLAVYNLSAPRCSRFLTFYPPLLRDLRSGRLLDTFCHLLVNPATLQAIGSAGPAESWMGSGSEL